MVRICSGSYFERGQPGHRYPSFHGTVTLPEGHWLRVKEKEQRERWERESAQLVKALEDAGCAEIWYAYRKTRRDAAANGEYASIPRWPEFLAANGSLAPTGYELNEAEAGAGNVQRRRPRIGDDGRCEWDWDDNLASDNCHIGRGEIMKN